ncbi:MAG: hypothetical protein KBG73_08040 [Candidatus Promineofilum sp.]|nr:hypothetical protein [Promineifilum sp.]
MTLTRAARCALLAWLSLAAVACADGRAVPTPTPTRPPRPTPTEPVGLLPSPTAEMTATPDPTPTIPAPVEANAQNLVQSFIEAPYRVVAVAKSPFAPYSLIVANERAPADCGSPDEPQRCTADDTCGSLYTAPVCFFFVEPSFDAAADPATRYVARWPDAPTLSGLVTDSLRFVDARTVEFRAAGGDGAYAVQEVWWLDIVTGALALQSRVENTG